VPLRPLIDLQLRLLVVCPADLDGDCHAPAPRRGAVDAPAPERFALRILSTG
jgi:hypothetical protein